MAKYKALRAGQTDIDSTDIWRFALHSDYPSQKIYEADEVTLTVESGEVGGSVNVNHSLNYVPVVYAMFSLGGGRYKRVNGLVPVARPVDGEFGFYGVTVTSSWINFEFAPSFDTAPAPSNINIPVKYIILYEEL